ncbi:MAG: MMPL family transporter [Deltaproteobacteria bacterium]|nr:MMPL family transporter [Deltaproteobacteria bacterium]
MMEALARALTRRQVAWAVVCVTLLATALGAFHATRVDQDDDVLKFLPKGNVDIAQFHLVNERFGGLDVALVGMEVDDPFDPAFLGKLRALTKTLNDEPGVAYSLSLTSVEDFTPENGGARVDYLVGALPKNDAEKAALRDKVMSRDHVVGNLISADGRSVLIYNFGKSGTSPRDLSSRVKRRVVEAFPDTKKYWGGAPFISTYIYDVTQADMRRLTPWAILVKLVIVVLVFRSVVGVLLTIASAGIGIVIAQGLMGFSRTPANVVLGSLPVILFALGSAYVTHVIVQYFTERAKLDADEAVVATLRDVGPPVLGAGLITAAGLFSFCAMDIGPLREFGVFAGLGILIALLLSLTFVPAVLVLTGASARALGGERFTAALAEFAASMTARRKPVAVALALVALVFGALASRVDARMENSAFFGKGSPPDEAETFLKERFGGSQFIQLAVDGDMNDADVLREVQRVADTIALLPHVSSVTHIGQVLSLSSEAMVGERRIPPSTEQVLPLYRFLAGRPSVRQLVAEELSTEGAKRPHALVLVKIDTDDHAAVGELLARIERLVATEAIRAYRFVGRNGEPTAEDVGARDARRIEVVTAELRALFHSFGVTVPPSDAFAKPLSMPAPTPDAKAAAVRLEKLLAASTDREIAADSEALGRAIAKLGPTPDDEALLAALAKVTEEDPSSDELDDLADVVRGALDQAWRPELLGARARQLLTALGAKAPEGAKGERFESRIGEILRDLDNRGALLATSGGVSDGAIAYTVSGTPVLNRGLSLSVRTNQWKSLAISLGLVLLIMVILYRSLTAGLLGIAPTALTLVVIYGSMSLLGLHLEVGTSMLASLIIGAGVDYGVHLLAGWRATQAEGEAQAARHAVAHSGLASFSNAVMVSAGFLVLTLGEARPLKTVGGLTGAAMLVAAVATFVVIPALARRTRYGRAQG